jgi:ParB family chromosome partitioning protein
MTKKDKNVLGRGLSELLKESALESVSKYALKANTTQNIAIDLIVPNPDQPRKYFNPDDLENLSQSIKTHGIIQPIIVKKEGAKYQVIAGERRLHAAKLAGLKEVPVYIREVNDEELLELGLIENIQRVDLTPIEIATSYKRLINECGIDQESLGNRVGKDRTTVTNYLRLLKLPSQVQVALNKNQLSMGHARAMLSLNSLDEQIVLLDRIIKEGLSVRQVEKIVSEHKKNKAIRGKSNTEVTSKFKNVALMLCEHLGTKVNIKLNKEEAGEIRISFDSMRDLSRIVDTFYTS